MFSKKRRVTFQYTKDPLFQTAHADGFVGGLTPNGQIHLAFFDERSLLPKKHVYRVNPDGSLGSEIPEGRVLNEPIARDIQLDVLMSMQTAEALKNWLDVYIRGLKARAAITPVETRLKGNPAEGTAGLPS